MGRGKTSYTRVTRDPMTAGNTESPLQRITKFVDAISRWIPSKTQPWWGWSSILLGLAFFSVLASILVYPEGAHEELWLFGVRFGGECGMDTAFGIPCPQCGMTRSWVYLVRGQLLRATTYNPGGVILLLWIVVGGCIGALRLVRRNPRFLSPPWTVLFIWCMFWIVGPYLGLYFARLAGVNILPEFTAEFHENPVVQPPP